VVKLNSMINDRSIGKRKSLKNTLLLILYCVFHGKFENL